MVLVIHRSEAMAQAAVDMFRYMDILAYGVRPKEAYAEVSARYRAVLMLYPEQLPDLTDFVQRLRMMAGTVPLFAISDALSAQDKQAFLHVFATGVMSSTVATEIIRISQAAGLPCIGDYRLSGIDASYHLYDCLAHGMPLSLTATEGRIVRFLIRAYPAPVNAADMLPYVFSPAKLPDVTTVRTHICAINRKCRTHKRSPLIELVPHGGYRIATPVDQPLLHV